LTVRGDWVFDAPVALEGDVSLPDTGATSHVPLG